MFRAFRVFLPSIVFTPDIASTPTLSPHGGRAPPCVGVTVSHVTATLNSVRSHLPVLTPCHSRVFGLTTNYLRLPIGGKETILFKVKTMDDQPSAIDNQQLNDLFDEYFPPIKEGEDE